MSQITPGSHTGCTLQESTVPDLQFASGGFLANIGAPLRSGDEADEGIEVGGDIDSDEEFGLSEDRYYNRSSPLF